MCTFFALFYSFDLGCLSRVISLHSTMQAMRQAPTTSWPYTTTTSRHSAKPPTASVTPRPPRPSRCARPPRPPRCARPPRCPRCPRCARCARPPRRPRPPSIRFRFQKQTNEWLLHLVLTCILSRPAKQVMCRA